MRKGATPYKGKKKDDIRSHLVTGSERMSLRSGTMADSLSSDEVESSASQKFYLDSLAKLEERHLDNLAKMEERHLDSLAKMEERLATQFNELRTGIANNNIVITEIKSNGEKADSNVDKIGNSVQNFSDEIKTISTSQKAVESSQAKLEVRLVKLEEKHAITERTNEDLIKNIELHDEEIKALKAEVETLKGYKEEVEKLKKDNAQFKIDNEAREQYQRKYNLWFYGIEEPEDEDRSWDTVKDFCVKVLNLDLDDVDLIPIKNDHRVGSTKMKQRPIIVVFSQWDDRQTVLKAAGKLYFFNKKNDTNFAVKTDLAPLARQKRKLYVGASIRMKEETKLFVRVCNNEKGQVWLESKKELKDRWLKVNEKDIKPRWLDPTTTDAASK